jgi:hypothetical protein
VVGCAESFEDMFKIKVHPPHNSQKRVITHRNKKYYVIYFGSKVSKMSLSIRVVNMNIPEISLRHLVTFFQKVKVFTSSLLYLEIEVFCVGKDKFASIIMFEV